jgi:hypothetical protein
MASRGASHPHAGYRRLADEEDAKDDENEPRGPLNPPPEDMADHEPENGHVVAVSRISLTELDVNTILSS